MPSVPDITLNKGQALLTQTDSVLGITMDNNALLNGVVVLINELSDLWAVGNVVLFDPTGATILQYDEQTYYMVTEDKIFYKENGAP